MMPFLRSEFVNVSLSVCICGIIRFRQCHCKRLLSATTPNNFLVNPANIQLNSTGVKVAWVFPQFDFETAPTTTGSTSALLVKMKRLRWCNRQKSKTNAKTYHTLQELFLLFRLRPDGCDDICRSTHIFLTLKDRL